MSSNLLSIASSGLNAAQAGLDVTAQNIANASTTGYIRQTVNQTELATPQNSGVSGDIAMSGVVVTSITRNVDAFMQAEARRTGSASAAADGLVTNLQNVDNAVEQSNVFTSITTFQSGLQQLSANPTDPSLRASVLANAQGMTQSFNLASQSLSQAAQGMQTDAGSGVTQVNTLAKNLAALNLQISSNTDPQTTQAGLLDQRDSMLQQLSQLTDITTTLGANGTATVQLGGASGPQLVSGGSAGTLSQTTAANGTISFALGGSAVAIAGGSLAADSQGLTAAANASTQLNGIANSLISAANTVQTGGVALNGAAGQPMFSGSGAGNIGVALSSGSQIATAPAGAAANSTDTTNLTALQNALTTANVAGGTNSLIFDLSSGVSTATTTKTALDAIASHAQTSLATQAGVDLNQEAANLLQYQQAFQASGKVIQVADTLFNQLLAIQ
jgi:flagellar hook-associated protein 1 FlgK